jgi:diketogulonate reductase-like aldo/keto reductase
MLRPARGIPRQFMEVITRMDVIESHGALIPILGFGTMTLKEDVCVQLVEASLKLGYRHLDTAQMYGNEREVGSGMRGSALKREDIFLTTKVWFTRLASGDFEHSVDESLERLALPWVDLLMIQAERTSAAFGIDCFAVQDEASGTNQAYRRRQF